MLAKKSEVIGCWNTVKEIWIVEATYKYYPIEKKSYSCFVVCMIDHEVYVIVTISISSENEGIPC